MEELKTMKHNLISCVQSQMSHLHDVDTKELGDAIDMIKDLSEAIYYCTVTEAMEGKDKWETDSRYGYTQPTYSGRMYYDGNKSGRMGGYTEREYVMPMRDMREGRSPMSRRTYMETKEMKMDKAASMKELEKYMQELTHDIVEMIEEASPEEKQYLEKCIAALANKVGQMNV